MNCARVPSIDVSLIGTKCGHLELEVVFQNDDDAKMCADRIGPWKNSPHNFRSRIGGNVVILWSQAANHVAHTTASEVRDVTIFAQARSNFARRLVHRQRLHPVTVAAWPREAQRITAVRMAGCIDRLRQLYVSSQGSSVSGTNE